MNHFRMELYGIQIFFRIGHGRHRGIGRARGYLKAGRRGFNPIAVAHPALLRLLHTGEKLILPYGFEASLAVLAVPGPFHNAPKLPGHQLHAVADTQDRDSRFVKGRIAGWRILLVNTGGTARKYDALRLSGFYLRNGSRKRKHFTENLKFPDTSCNQVAVLSAEIQDDN
ncbi:MAG: hypothetical protein BWY80_01230 [Firmicutes bacterium ADurb.Bin456]|nr:MAG: hypothetical protein BWY80_01230 [Firmicutes bacterium ADurb.Bin456]